MKERKWIESSYLARYFLLNAVDITDHEVFPYRVIQNSAPVFHFLPPENSSTASALLNHIVPFPSKRPGSETVDHFLEHNGTTAFLVIRHDRLIVERYYNGYEHSSICTSFSMAKSFVSALVGIALHENLIKSLDDPITRYLPEFTEQHWSAISIRDLVSMCSGLKYDEGRSFPWNDHPRVYYSLDLRHLVRQARSIAAPGTRFLYNNYNLILLGMILERVTSATVSEYLQERIWKPLGMESPASWSLDSRRSGMEKMESGLNALAIDFARFGRLYLHKGDWNGRQIVPESWVKESTTVLPDAMWTHYGYLWWITGAEKGRFMAAGNLGQYIYIAPDKDCIILRFGRGKPVNWKQVYTPIFASLLEIL